MKSNCSRALVIAASAVHGLLLCATATADCLVSPSIRANVKVVSCLGVTYEAPKWNSTARNQKDNLLHYYTHGSSISGTLLTVEVTSSMQRLINNKWSYESNAGAWSIGKRLDVFVQSPSDTACPPERYVMAMVQTIPYCCDVLPVKDLCMLPGSVIPASIGYAVR